MPGSFSSSSQSSSLSLDRRHPYARRPSSLRSLNFSNNSTPSPSSNSPPRLKLIPRPYNPRMPINDELYGTDPHPEACNLYLKQAQKLWEQKQLATFDRAGETYTRWVCGYLGIARLNIALRTGQLVEPAFCHHIMNNQRDSSWCKHSVVWWHSDDPNLDVIGYMMPTTHNCIAHPIYSPHLRRQGSQPLMAEYIADDEDEDELDSDLEKTYAAILRPRPRLISAATADVDDEADAGVDCATLLSLNPDLALADNKATFNTDQFIYNHLDVNLLSTDLHNQPRYSTSSMFKQQRRTWEQALSSAPLTPTKRKSLYSKKESEGRKLTDAALTESILTAAEGGQYHENPMTHPSFDTQAPETTPACLQTFHNPGAISLASMRSSYSQETQIGTAILQLNGLIGISVLEFCELRKRTVKCLSCLCYFSPEGYQQHVEYAMVCHNTPTKDPAPDLSSIFDACPFEVEERFPEGVMRFNNPSNMNPIGLAWMMWNSPAGVTHDVWVQLIMAWRRCSGGCDRVRSFKAHLDHLEEDPCAAFGDEALGVFPPGTDEGVDG
ncbi:hypothetical protein BT96DRAFT_984672 [Gymnopus androsaceus JB14]|uniref:Uncharacterized protein n=1 Tax=Gymnopus androsaceus JB14 TaxID=1447944 RepID=A0A6A4IME2_9AGAR|nr:hypothetical protein BT96DRAFT_984672 [Gymnopus androsaceus JB14]